MSSGNGLTSDKIGDWFKLKAFADDKMNVAQMMISVLDWVENIVGKEENAGSQQFLFFPQCFENPYSSRSLKVGTVWYRVNLSQKEKGRKCLVTINFSFSHDDSSFLRVF